MHILKLFNLSAALLLTSLLAFFQVSKASAEVAEQSAQHFVVKHSFTTQRSPAAVYHQFGQVQRWWEPSHSFAGIANNLYFNFVDQRCFCEKLADGGFVEHLAVIHVQPEKKVVFSGGLGPLQEQPVSGKLIWQFKPVDKTSDKGTQVTLEYRVFGHIVGGMKKWPVAVDFVLGTQLGNLQKLLE